MNIPHTVKEKEKDKIRVSAQSTWNYSIIHLHNVLEKVVYRVKHRVPVNCSNTC